MPRASRLPLEIILVSLDKKRTIHPPDFPRYPRLYLELLQNTEKIKTEYLKQEFTPNYEIPNILFDNDGDDISHANIVTGTENRMVREEGKTQLSKNERGETRGREEPRETRGREEPRETRSREEPRETRGREEPRETRSREEPRETRSREEPRETRNRELNDEYESPRREKIGEKLNEDSLELDEDPISAFLRKSRSIGTKQVNYTEKKISFEKNKHDILRNERKLPPSLADLEDDNSFKGIRDMGRGISKKEQEKEQKLREYLFKYELLRKAHPTEEIPRFTINSDPEYVTKTYEDILRNLSLTDNINKYKRYLMFGFMAVEAFGGKVLGFDMKGFVKQQVIEMSSYEKLLIELGEKHYIPKSNLPVELRLAGMIIMNAAFFLATKMALKATGTDVLNAMNNTAKAGVDAANIQQRKKQKMSGPSINLDDIPNLNLPSKEVDSSEPTFV